jgi:hypothetical protein
MSSSLSKFASPGFIKDSDLMISGTSRDSSDEDVILITVKQENAHTHGRFVFDQVKGTWTATIPAGGIQPGRVLAFGLHATFVETPEFTGHTTFSWASNVDIEPLPASKNPPES